MIVATTTSLTGKLITYTLVGLIITDYFHSRLSNTGCVEYIKENSNIRIL